MKPLLVLDLDETLWHGKLHQEEVTWFETRPYLAEFIQDITPHYSLGIWSAGTTPWVEYGLEHVRTRLGIDFKALCEFVWDRRRCTETSFINYEPYGDCYPRRFFAKPVRKFRSLKIPKERILVVDDSPENYLDGYGHLVRTTPWLGDPSDYELIDLAKYLVAIKDVPNFRALEKRNWRSKI